MSHDGKRPKQADLAKLVEAKRAFYDSCLTKVEHEFTISEDISATLDLHFVQFDGTGEPKFRLLAKNLVSHLISYATAQTRRPILDPVLSGKLFQEARDNLNLKPDSGEPGEVLLYFLLETVLGAPQLICKIDLKTNRNDEVKGCDGVHAIWDESKDRLVLFIGEAKLHGQFANAVASAFASIEKLHDENTLERDLLLTTKHFKYADGPVRDHVIDVLTLDSAKENFDLVHACLIGYDWSQYADLTGKDRAQFIAEFEQLLLKNIEDHRLKTLQGHLGKFSRKHLKFHFFFLPFKSVEEFRIAFNEAATGKS